MTLPETETIRSVAQEVVAEMVGGPVGGSEPLISSGRIDSLSILKLISRLEKALNIAIPSEDLQPEDFDNIDYITETIVRVGRAR